MFALFGLLSTIFGFESPNVSTMLHLVALVAVPVRATTGTKGNKLVRNPIFPYAGLNVDLKHKREKPLLKENSRNLYQNLFL